MVTLRIGESLRGQAQKKGAPVPRSLSPAASQRAGQYPIMLDDALGLPLEIAGAAYEMRSDPKSLLDRVDTTYSSAEAKREPAESPLV